MLWSLSEWPRHSLDTRQSNPSRHRYRSRSHRRLRHRSLRTDRRQTSDTIFNFTDFSITEWVNCIFPVPVCSFLTVLSVWNHVKAPWLFRIVTDSYRRVFLLLLSLFFQIVAAWLSAVNIKSFFLKLVQPDSLQVFWVFFSQTSTVRVFTSIAFHLDCNQLCCSFS